MKKMSLTILKVLRVISVIIGCFLFLFSTILPFYHRAYFASSMIPEDRFYYSVYYWSFRALRESRNLFGGYGTSRSVNYWFYEPGFYDYVPGPLFSKLSILILAAQFLTLVSAIVSLFSKRRILALAPLLSCSLVTVLMICINIVLSQSNILIRDYLLGYWLTYPSTMMFLLSFALTLVIKRNTSYTPTPTLTQ